MLFKNIFRAIMILHYNYNNHIPVLHNRITSSCWTTFDDLKAKDDLNIAAWTGLMTDIGNLNCMYVNQPLV